ncbi:hypothetical protein [Streptomyces aureocirculatus]|uniref:hypothetical protein n=1 Tax=Streptomyces aureocirculatus TaxID=67275 RepID=UPI000A83EA9E|nr:hypothetical protein [Streptomyces aureocirculatus]
MAGPPIAEPTDSCGAFWGSEKGWHCEIVGGLVTAYPVNSIGNEPEPPATVWRSFKNDRSYLYDLRPAEPQRDSSDPP